MFNRFVYDSGDTSLIRHPSPQLQRQVPRGLIPGYVRTTIVFRSQLKGGFQHWDNGVWCRRDVSICWMARAGVRWEPRWRRANVTGKTTTGAERCLETVGMQGQPIQESGCRFTRTYTLKISVTVCQECAEMCLRVNCKDVGAVWHYSNYFSNMSNYFPNCFRNFAQITK